jgi:hypothetical protein
VLALANSFANELWIMSVHRTHKSSFWKTERQLFEVIQTY